MVNCDRLSVVRIVYGQMHLIKAIERRCSNAILLLFFFIHVFFSLYLLLPFNISLTKYNIYENIVFFFFLFHLHKKYASQYRTIFFLFLLYTENIHFFMSPKNYFQRYSICMYLFCFFLSFNSKKWRQFLTIIFYLIPILFFCLKF